MEAWRTSCPRLTVWEDAVEAGLVRRERAAAHLPIAAAVSRNRVTWLILGQRSEVWSRSAKLLFLMRLSALRS